MRKKFVYVSLAVCFMLIMSSIITFGDARDGKQIVHKNKVWKFSFKEKVRYEDLDEEAIFVEDSEGKIASVAYYLENNGRTLLIKPSGDGYEEGEYILFISTGIGSSNESTNYLTIEFIVESAEKSRVKEDEAFKRKTFSVKTDHLSFKDIQYDISLENMITGDDAWEMVRESNIFNSKPKSGKEYILAKFNIRLYESYNGIKVKFDKNMFDFVNSKNKVYGKNQQRIIIDGELDSRISQGETCSGWIAGYVDIADNPSIVVNRGEECEVIFRLKDDSYKPAVSNDKEETNGKKDEKDTTDKESIFTKEELLEFLKKNKESLFKDTIKTEGLNKDSLEEYMKENNINNREELLYYLKDFKGINNYKNSEDNDDSLMMMYLYQMLNQKGNK